MVERIHLIDMLNNISVKSSSKQIDLVLFLTFENKYRTIAGPEEEKNMSAWLKDAISGLFLMTFIVASFGMADMARAVIGS
jgi:hypothetical protein